MSKIKTAIAFILSLILLLIVFNFTNLSLIYKEFIKNKFWSGLSFTSQNQVNSTFQCSDFLTDCQTNILFTRVNLSGDVDTYGTNYVLIFNPQKDLDFKVNLPVKDNLITQNQINPNFQAQFFKNLVANDNSLLNGKKPLAGINADYINSDFSPQGLNVSRGLIYKGIFSNLRSNFAISKTGKVSIGTGLRPNLEDNFNLTSGNGRFYTNGVFSDICDKLGEYACKISTNRSMGAITDKNLVIFLVHKSSRDSFLLPADFQTILEGISRRFNLGKIQDALLFDGGKSPAMFYKDFLVDSGGEIGSVFLIYEK